MIDTDLDYYLMSNLPPKFTGLPFVVWISPKGNAQHDVRVKVSMSPRAKPEEFITVTVRPEVRELGLPPRLRASELRVLRRWIELNRDVLVRFWDGDIEYTTHVLDLLKPLPVEPL
jgi:hypothetical protein